MRGEAKTRIGMLLASGALSVAIAFQAIGAFDIRFGPIEEQPFLWPFLDYPMYSTARVEGQEIPVETLVGILPDSSEIEIDHGDFGMKIWHFHQEVLRSILHCQGEELATFLPRYEGRNDKRLVGLRLEDRPLVLTEAGIERAPVRILAAVDIESESVVVRRDDDGRLPVGCTK